MACPVLDKINTGDLLAWGHSPGNHETLWIKIIRLLTMSEFGHVSIAWRIDGELWHVEAVIPRIRIAKIDEARGFYSIGLSKMLGHAPDMKFFSDKVGKPYSFMDAVRAYLGLTTKNDDKWQCAELAKEFYDYQGLHLNPESLTPANLMRAAMEVADLSALKPCT